LWKNLRSEILFHLLVTQSLLNLYFKYYFISNYFESASFIESSVDDVMISLRPWHENITTAFFLSKQKLGSASCLQEQEQGQDFLAWTEKSYRNTGQEKNFPQIRTGIQDRVFFTGTGPVNRVFLQEKTSLIWHPADISFCPTQAGPYFCYGFASRPLFPVFNSCIPVLILQEYRKSSLNARTL